MERQREDASDAHRLAGLDDPFAVNPDMAAIDQKLGKRAAFHQPDAVQVAVDPQGSALEVGERGEGVARPLVIGLRPLAASPAPAPRIGSAGEADVGHQPGDRVVAEPDRPRKLGVDWILAAGGANLVGVAREAVGEIDPDPLAADPAIGKRGAARIGLRPEQRRSRRRERRQRLARPNRGQCSSPALRGASLSACLSSPKRLW